MTLVLKQVPSFLAIMLLLVPVAASQKKDAEPENATLRQHADKMGFWVGTTIQGRMWNRDPQYKPGPDAKLNRPEDVAQAVLFALQQPEGCEVRELMIAASVEPSWP